MVAGGLAVGVLDISEVIVLGIVRGVSPLTVLQSVATGLLGKAAYRGGAGTALLGLMLHFVIAFTVVAVYHVAASKFEILRRHWLICGALYGVGVLIVMNFVVLPLSAAGAPKWTTLRIFNGLFTHLFCIGIPAAWFAREPQPAARTALATE